MADLDSSSDFADIVNEYIDSSSYAKYNDLSKAKDFEHACQILLIKYPSMSAKGSASVGWSTNLTEIRQELRRVRAWLEARSLAYREGPDAILPDFTECRGS